MPRGGSRPGAGRPVTGRSTETISLRLPRDLAMTIKLRAAANNQSLTAFMLPILRNQFSPRRSRSGQQPQ